MKRSQLFPAVAVLALACFASSASAQQYAVTNLGSLTGFPNPTPHSINNLGQVAGDAFASNFLTFHAFLTAPNATIQPSNDLGLLPGATSASANSVNNSGQVVGTDSGFSDFSARAFRVDPSSPTTLVNLGIRSGTLSGLASSNANGINDSGEVTGQATEDTLTLCGPGFVARAYLTVADGTVATAADLGTLLTDNCGTSTGFAVNSTGQVVGNSNFNGAVDGHAFLKSTNQVMQDLGTLCGTACTSTANAINNIGEIVGQSSLSPATPFTTHAFLTLTTATGPGPMHDLGTLGGSTSQALGINNSNQIVGSSTTTGDAAIHAFIYQSSTMTDLNTLIPSGTGWVLESGFSINDVGQIVGTGTLNGVFSAFRLDPAGANGVNILISEVSNGTLPLTVSEADGFKAELNLASALIGGGPFMEQLGGLVLRIFVVEVTLLEDNGRLTSAEAGPLVSEADNIINNL